MGVRVKYNNLPAVIKALPKAIDVTVDDAAQDISGVLKRILWKDTGKIRRVTTHRDRGQFHAEVWIGYYLGHGFYSGFQEFGTYKQAARPIVGPTAHQYEMVYAKNMGDAVKKACNAR